MGRVVNAIGTADKEAFAQALLESLSNLYDKTNETDLRRLYRVLGGQLADADVQVEAFKYDNYLSTRVVDEQVVREDATRDRLEEENVFELERIGFVPTNFLRSQNVSLTPADTEIILQYIPVNISSISIYEMSDPNRQSVVTVTSYNSIRNSISITGVPRVSRYTVQYPETGNVKDINKTIDLLDIPEDSSYGYGYGYGSRRTIQLDKNIIYNSERVFLIGSNVGVFVRDRDYTLDYTTGVMTIVPDGAIDINIDDVVHNLSIEYRYKVDFSSVVTAEFHTQVFNEYATLVDDFELKVDNSPLSDVFRVFNTTTRENYTVTSFNRDRIKFSGVVAPRRTALTKQGYLKEIAIDRTRFISKVSVVYPEDKIVSQHPLVSINSIQAKTDYIRLVEAGRDVLLKTYTLKTSAEVSAVVLRTGHPNKLKQSQITLQENVDYSFEQGNGEITITLFDSAINRIASNSLYMQLIKDFTAIDFELKDNEYRTSYRENPVYEDIRFTSKSMPLTKLPTFVKEGQEDDLHAEGFIVVTNNSSTIVYQKDVDYEVDFENKRITLTNNGSLQIGDYITVFYSDPQQYFVDYIYMQDGVVVDYDWTNNSLNWSRSFVDTEIQQIEKLDSNKIFVKLDKRPVDFASILIYRYGDDDKTPITQVVDFISDSNEVEIAPVFYEDTYVLEYTGRDHLIEPDESYYVTYKFGARRYALEDNFAQLLGIERTERRRAETKNLIANQTSISLNFSPLTLDNIVIYEEGDSSKASVTTAISFDEATGILKVRPIRESDTYIVEYDTAGALTEDLRKTIIGLILAFLEGPTKKGISDLIRTFTNKDPIINRMSDLAFRMTDEDEADPDLRSNRLSDLGTESSDVEFLPARFNAGVLCDSTKGSYVRAPMSTNVRIDEGTDQFLLGPRFEGNDQQTHYFIDIGSSETPYKNRISLYKNKRGLLAFEIFDKNGELYRVTTNINRRKVTEFFHLKKGDKQAKLSYKPTYSTTDIDDNGQADILAAQPTEFVIRPVYDKLIDPVLKNNPLGISTLIQIKKNVDYASGSGFNMVTAKLLALADAAEDVGAKLVIHSESEYIDGNKNISNVLQNLQNRGHEIGVYIDFPIGSTTNTERIAYIKKRKQALEDLGIKVYSCSGGYDATNWQYLFAQAGLQLISAYINPSTGEGPEKFSTSLYRVNLNTEFTGFESQSISSDSPLVYLPGAAHLQWTKPINAQSLQQIESSLRTSISKAQTNAVNSWYFLLNIEDFSNANFENEVSLIKNWFSDTISPMVDLGKVRWNTFRELFDLFIALEDYLEELISKQEIELDKTTLLRALKYNYTSKKITFDPAPIDGLYEFSYIIGWSAYEESEVMLTVTWKLHTRDGTLPFYKLFVDGELQELRVFGDLSA